MSTFLVKFAISLGLPSEQAGILSGGAIFHRWLPDGEQDGVVVATGDPNAYLKIWFERMGYVSDLGGLIVFEPQRRDVDPEIMCQQAFLTAGPLVGLLKVEGLSEDDLAAVRENRIGDAQYVALGKRIVTKLIVPHVSRFINTLRANYGQYWIRELEAWDSRTQSLGRYCSRTLDLSWSLDSGETWTPFVADEPIGTRHVITTDYFRQYLDEEDWTQIAQAVGEGYEPSMAALILARSHQFLHQGYLRQAIIEGVSALEVALSEFVREELGGADGLLESMQAFWNLPLRSQAVVVAALSGKASAQDLRHTVQAIDTRNRLVHEGQKPPDDAELHLAGLFKTVSALLSGPTFRYPPFPSFNCLMSPHEWEQAARVADKIRRGRVPNLQRRKRAGQESDRGEAAPG